MKRVIVVFILAFALNLIWENIHSVLYENYMGGRITEFILLRATLADAIMITAIAAPFICIPALRTYRWLAIALWFALAVAIELYALNTHRWAYGALMPLIPILNIGLTPTIQLAFLGYLSLRFTERFSSNADIGQP